MSRYESLETKAMRKISPRTIQELPSPVLDKGKNELAKYIQRTYRSKNKHATYRKGSKMTKKAMRRQLYYVYGNQLREFLIKDLYHIINKEQGTDLDKIKYLFDNLERPLLEKIYNYTWSLENDEEDRIHINNPMYFRQPEVPPSTYSSGKKTKKKIKKKTKKKQRKKDKLT